MSLIKEVRLKYEFTNSNGYTESQTNYKLCLNDGDGVKGKSKNDRFITVKLIDKKTNQENFITKFSSSYDYNRRYKDFTDDDYINDWINNQDKQGNNFLILQNPWQDDLPVKRNYGLGYYYLSNGSRVSINWTSKLDFTYQNGEIKTAYGYEYDENSDTYINGSGDVLPDYLFSFSGRPAFNLFGKLTSNFIVIGGEKWSDDNGNEIGTRYVDNQKLPPVGGYSFGLEKSYDELLAIHVASVLDGNPTTYFEPDPSGDGFIPVYNFYGEPYDDVGLPYYVSSIKGEAIEKTVLIFPPSESKDGLLKISDDKKIKASNELPIGATSSGSIEKKWNGSVADLDILKEILDIWNKKVPNYNLELCNLDQLDSSGGSEYCRLIEYKSPISEPESDPESPQKTEESEQGKGKIKLSVVLPEDLELRVKEDLNELKIYVGEPPLAPSDFVFQDDFDNLEELDPEFAEGGFLGEEELEEIELIMKEPDDDLRNEIERAGEELENSSENSSGESIAFDHSSKKFIKPDTNKKYSESYKPYIDYNKMPKPILTKKKLIEVKLKVEGGLTGNPNDSAAKSGFCPKSHTDGKKYHTNKGVTYAVWKTVFGSGNDGRFLKMSHADWEKVFDSKYWNKHGNSSKYESVNALLVSFAWGGSKDATVNAAKRILGVSSFDSVSESEAVAALLSARAQLFINISKPGTKNNVFRVGWINAANAFVKSSYNLS